MAEWYLYVDGNQTGPVSEEQVVADLRSGTLDGATMVFTEGMPDWMAAREIPKLAPHVGAGRAVAARQPVAAAPAASAAPAAAAPRAAHPGGDVVSHTLDQFLAATGEKDNPGDVFELESSHMLEVHVRGRVWSKLGAMVAYRGDLKFVREGAFEGGLGKFVSKMVSGETAPLAKIEGSGVVYLADQKKDITILRLTGREAFNVNGNDLLAFEDTVQYEITMHRRVASMLAGGLFSLRLTGQGMVAIVSHGKPLTLRVTPSDPIVTDPNATVAWSGSLTPEFKSDISFRTLLGRGGGEAFQMMFRGDGFVVVQPFEETPVPQGQQA
jgi:uncharacterized protein (AIM24 family)